MTNIKGTLSMKYINAHAGIIIRVSNRAIDPSLNRDRMITALIGVNDTDRHRIRARIDQMLADA